MDGQTAVSFEQASAQPAEFAQEPLESEQIDPTSAFLEKYGSALIANHRGEMVTAAEAMVCSAFARLVAAGLGEVALASGAPALPEENEEVEPEEETEEAGAKEEAKTEEAGVEEGAKTEETKIGKEVEVKGLDKSAANIKNEKIETTQEVPEPWQSQGYDDTRQEAGINKVIVGDNEPAEFSARVPAKGPALEQTDQMSERTATIPRGIKEPNPQVDEASQTNKLLLELEPQLESSEGDTKIRFEITGKDNEHDLAPQVKEDYLPLEESVEIELSKELAGEAIFMTGQEALAPNILESSQLNAETVIELDLPAEEIEQTVQQLTESIERMDAEEIEIANHLLDGIVQKINEAQSQEISILENPEAVIENGDIEEELRELFVQLFDFVEIEYSPELIESLVKIALQGEISEMLIRIEQADDNANVQQDRGTHEVIKQLLAAIGKIKQSVQHAYLIGKSALQLYSQELLFDLRPHPVYVTVV